VVLDDAHIVFQFKDKHLILLLLIFGEHVSIVLESEDGAGSL
jgi:hypothetical protein